MSKGYFLFLFVAVLFSNVIYVDARENHDFGHVSYGNEVERWDKDNYIYSNYQYGFGWNLPPDLEWKRVIGQERHTVFRAEGAPFSVFANIQDMVGELDLWQKYSQITELLLDVDLKIEKASGMIVYERTFEKCNLLGKRAIKTTFKEYFSDSRYDRPQENIAVEYLVVLDGYLFILAVKMPKQIYDEYDCTEAISNIFKGFRLATKY